MDEIEEKIPHLKQFALHEFGIEVTLVDRRNVFYPNGKHDEVNLYVEGKKDGHTQYLIGECKAQPGKKDFDKFGQDTACFGAGSQWLVASMIQLPFYARLKNRAIFLVLPDYVVMCNPRTDAATRVFWSLLKMESRNRIARYLQI